MARPDKAADVAELVESFQESAGAVLTEYRGLTVKQLQELRRALGDNASYAVVKNTLTQIAATEAGIDGFDELLTGPTAIAFINGDVVEAAKGLRDFARTNPALVVKGGILEGNLLDATEIARLADLESREVLLGRIAGGMLANHRGGHRGSRWFDWAVGIAAFAIGLPRGVLFVVCGIELLAGLALLALRPKEKRISP